MIGMPAISKARRRDVQRNKGQRHRVHANFDAQYTAMYARELERREAIARRMQLATKQAVVEGLTR